MSDHDPCEDLLSHAEPRPPDERFRQVLLNRTLRVLRRRRLQRRLALVASLAACYLAGLVTMHYWSPAPQAADVPPAGLVAENQPPPGLPASVKQANEFEMQALANPVNKAELLRDAGNLYLSREFDGPAALRCYVASLDAVTARDLTISSSDDWLLMALKADKKRKE